MEKNNISGRYSSLNNNTNNNNINLDNKMSNYNSPSINKADINLLLYDNYNDYINDNSSIKKNSLFQHFNNNCKTYSSNIYNESANISYMSEGKKSNINNINYQILKPVNLNNIYTQQLNNTLYNNNIALRNVNSFSSYINVNTYNTMNQPYNKLNPNLYNNSKTIDYNISPSPYMFLYSRKSMNKTPEVNKIRIKGKNDNHIYINSANCFDTDIIAIGVNEFLEGEKIRNTIPQFNNIKIIN